MNEEKMGILRTILRYAKVAQEIMELREELLVEITSTNATEEELILVKRADDLLRAVQNEISREAEVLLDTFMEEGGESE